MFTSIRHFHPKHNPDAEQDAFNDLCIEVGADMEARLNVKREDGYTGWDDPDAVSEADLLRLLNDNVRDRDWLDVLCIAAILWNRTYEETH